MCLSVHVLMRTQRQAKAYRRSNGHRLDNNINGAMVKVVSSWPRKNTQERMTMLKLALGKENVLDGFMEIDKNGYVEIWIAL